MRQRRGRSRPRPGGARLPEGGVVTKARDVIEGFGYTNIGSRTETEFDDVLSSETIANMAGLPAALDAIREGVTAWPQLWMGYEDLAIGWELQRRGWTQLLSHAVRVNDNYEFRPVRVFGRSVHIASKPSWYNYYQLRNLWLIADQTGGRAVTKANVFRRLFVDVGLILLYRDRKTERLQLLFRGLRDGLDGVSGKGPVP